ncbi:MAG: TIGR02281 family clan AA aspartic protease [Myxococcota bacterium]
MAQLALFPALFALLCAAPAAAEIYRWTDAEGDLHFTQDLSQVPAPHREQARRAASGPPAGSLQTFSPPRSVAPVARHRSGGSIEIPFERFGTLMRVNAVVNDRELVPFLIDTGASGVSLPSHVAEMLGITIRPDTPRVTVQTANGPISVPVVKLDSVELGDARIEGLHATVNRSLDVGLLGGSFFNNYRYSIDAAAGVISLSPNDRVRGGAVAAQWRDRFQALRSSIDRLETYLALRDITREDRRRELEENLAGLKRDLGQLEIEATRAGVPHAWRR